jgi:sRNA-binding carbon storage regulator CsrA
VRSQRLYYVAPPLALFYLLEELTMLVVGRRHKEEIIIDLRDHGLGLIRVINVGRHNGSTRIGIDCDKRIVAHRKEVFEKEEAKRNPPLA